MVFLQYYVTESATGNRIDIEIDAATKTELDITRNGWQTVWDTDFILDWVPTVFSREAWLFILPIWKANRKVTQR